MRRSKTKYLLTAGLLTLGSLAFAPGCATNDSSMFVVGVIAINESACLAKPDTTAAMLPAGVLDTVFKQDYTAFLLVGNQLTQRGSREQLRTETSRVSLRGAEVTLTTLGGEDIKITRTDAAGKTTTSSAHYSTVGTGFVDAAAGDAPSYAAVSVSLIPAAVAASGSLPGQVLAKIRVFGNTLGGKSVTSSELDFPITICSGCLVTYPAQGDPTAATYMCPSPSAADMASAAAAPCILGQDAPISCTLCSASYDACKDPTKNPAYMSSMTP
ncbi:MAG: hypothetical protein ABJB12_00210 [Pseudomonadota bacterium]